MKSLAVILLALLAFSTVAAEGPWQDRPTQVTVAWDYPSDDYSFRLYVSDEPGSYFSAQRFDVAAGARSFTVVGLEPDRPRYFVVTAVDSIGFESLPSEEVAWVPSLPQAPTGMRVAEVRVTTVLVP